MDAIESMTLFFCVELLGTVAFAISGSMVAIRKNLDLLGIIVLGVITACGGGMIRDTLIGNLPPMLFVNPIYVSVATVSAIILFILVRYLKISIEILESERYDLIISISDAVGLGAFTIVGIDTAIAMGLDRYDFLVVFLGVITGVGGGVLRDIMAGEVPAVLRKHVYACASIAGAILYTVIMDIIDQGLAMLISISLVVMIRYEARRHRWNLPRAVK